MSFPNSISIPVALLFTVVTSILSAGVTWGATVGRISAAEAAHYRLEKRVEKLEDAVTRILPLLERIDERTARQDRLKG